MDYQIVAISVLSVTLLTAVLKQQNFNKYAFDKCLDPDTHCVAINIATTTILLIRFAHCAQLSTLPLTDLLPDDIILYTPNVLSRVTLAALVRELICPAWVHSITIKIRAQALISARTLIILFLIHLHKSI